MAYQPRWLRTRRTKPTAVHLTVNISGDPKPTERQIMAELERLSAAGSKFRLDGHA